MKVTAQFDYTKIREIGQGKGMNSRVWLVDDPQLGGNLVAKEIPITSLGNDASQYFAESQAVFASQHRNVCVINHAAQTSTHICVLMPYYRNGSLADLISVSPISPRTVIRTGLAILSGLEVIHQTGFLHLDIKPTNVLYGDDGTPLIADFGQARKVDVSTGTVTAPPMYLFGLPPECISTGRATHQSDIFQVGMTLYRALNGNEVFSNQKSGDQQHVMEMLRKGEFPARSSYLPHINQSLRTLVNKALKVDPKDRFGGVRNFAECLAKIRVPIDWKCKLDPQTDSAEWKGSSPKHVPLIVRSSPKDKGYEITTEKETRGGRKKIHMHCQVVMPGELLASLDRIFRALEKDAAS